jgi:hypothetical protein
VPRLGEERWGALAVAACAAHLLIALALIPPWQHPDEPTHVAWAERQRSRVTMTHGYQAGRELEILQSMARYGWAAHRAVGFEMPTVYHDNFGPRVGVPSDSGEPTAYYSLAGRGLAWLPTTLVLQDMYALRVVSAVLGALTVWIVWRAGRLCFGALGGITIAFLLALHPQFVSVSAGAAPDALVNVLGAIVWWQIAAAVVTASVLPLLWVWLAAIAAAAADRMGVPLLATASLASMVGSATRFESRRCSRPRTRYLVR